MHDRRGFISGLSAAFTAGAIWPQGLLATSVEKLSDKHGPVLPSRPLGNTGEKITMLGLGGQHYRRLEGDDRAKAIEISINGGIRFFDTATMYGENALSERLFGQHLTPKYRDEIYLMTKSVSKDPKSVRKDLENSLRNLKTDVIDLWQVHAIDTVEDVDARWNSGVVDVFLQAREEGKVRHIGFSGHKHPAVQIHMIHQFRNRGIKVEAAQFPVNVCDPAYASFIREVVPLCLENHIAVLAMKTMCGGRMFGGVGEAWGPRGNVSVDSLIPEAMSFRDATDYVWSLPITSRIAGFDTLGQLEENINAAKAAGALTPERLNKILGIAAANSGPVREYYKRNTLAPADAKERKF